jgi:ketosteroid isomerase-like protein
VSGKRGIVRRQLKGQVRQLFGFLVAGKFADFLSGCADDLAVTVRGSTPAPMTLTKADIADWYGSLQALSPTSLRSSVEVTRVEGNKVTVILRHTFGRQGVDYTLEMVNLITVRDGLLAQWSSYPLDLAEYARAWRTHDYATLATA